MVQNVPRPSKMFPKLRLRCLRVFSTLLVLGWPCPRLAWPGLAPMGPLLTMAPSSVSYQSTHNEQPKQCKHDPFHIIGGLILVGTF